MDDDQQFCLRWNNHQSTLISVFDTLLENETLVDCTLAAEGKFLKAHKVVLSACSPYFATLLSEQYDKHPIFILKDVKYQELRAMMDYMYRGEVNISQDQLAALLKAAESLQIKGLSDNRGGSSSSGHGGGSQQQKSSAEQQQQQQQHKHINVPGKLMAGSAAAGYTLEQTKRSRIGPSSIDSQDLSGSREGSSSPTSRRRKKIRRRSIDNVLADNHDNSNSSQIIQAGTSSIIPTTNATGAITAMVPVVGGVVGSGAGTISTIAGTIASTVTTSSSLATAAANAAANIITANVTKKTESVKMGNTDAMNAAAITADNIQDENAADSVDKDMIIKEKQNHKRSKHQHHLDGSTSAGKESEIVIEPKSEYDDEGNDETVEDLTLDDEEMGLEDLDHNAGPSHGGEGSSQGYAQWQVDRSQDDVFMAAQEAQQRDPQDSASDLDEESVDDFQYFNVIKCEDPDEKTLSIYHGDNEMLDFDNTLNRNAEALSTSESKAAIKISDTGSNQIEPAKPTVETVNRVHSLKISAIHCGRRKKTELFLKTNELTPLPDASRMILLRPIKHMYKMFLLGKPLENNDRTKISKAIIDECLKYNPERVLSREDFFILANTITEVFKTEVQSVYYVPSAKSIPARGKLFNAYNNKRTTLSSEGLISRRKKKNSKRGKKVNGKRTTYKTRTKNDPDEKRKFSPMGIDLENLKYLEHNSSDSVWPDILNKWRLTYTLRQAELKSYLSIRDYIKKYSALQRESGIELVNIDLKMLYPNVADVSNWMALYPKVVNRARSSKDNSVLSLVAEIDNSFDERYKAGLSLILIAYILPNSGKRSESGANKATKSEIQRRFIKEYQSVSQIDAEQGEPTDLQIRFVKEDGAITYADFTIAGFKFKCGDILEALNIAVQYIMALDEKYPNICLHVWQFVQLAIFKIDLPDTKVPFIETTINDLLMDVRTTK